LELETDTKLDDWWR